MSAPTTWRDYADRLTPDQIADFEAMGSTSDAELAYAFPSTPVEESRQRIAESMLKSARLQAEHRHIPLPPGAADADTWQDDGDGDISRVVYGRRWEVDHMNVFVSAVQTADGAAEWSLTAAVDDEDTTPELVRRFAAALLDAADEYEKLTDEGQQ